MFFLVEWPIKCIKPPYRVVERLCEKPYVHIAVKFNVYNVYKGNLSIKLLKRKCRMADYKKIHGLDLLRYLYISVAAVWCSYEV